MIAAIRENTEALWTAGQDIDIPAYLATVNAQRRVLAKIELQRRQRDVTPRTSGKRFEFAPQNQGNQNN